MPDPTDAELIRIEDHFADKEDSEAACLIRDICKALRACRRQSEAKDAVVEAAQEMRNCNSARLSNSQRLGRLWKALAALDKET